MPYICEISSNLPPLDKHVFKGINCATHLLVPGTSVFFRVPVFTFSVHQRLCTVSFFFPMGRQSRCSGCKELGSAHDFGRPGK